MPPLAVAVTGGIGAGKSEALRAFERRGVPVRSSDELVHRLIADDPDVRNALEERFGTTDRGEIAAIVFGDPDELAWLEGLLHPRVRELYAAWREGLDEDLAVIEVPLLYETGADRLFDAVVVITAPEDVRAGRAPALVERSARLLPDDEKVRRADFAFVNDGPLDALDAFVGDVLEQLRAGR
jgi:dephospho-CoA kinase